MNEGKQMRWLALQSKKKIALFWDNAGWHKGSVTQEFVKADGNIAIVWLPRYAPEENPQENVWKAGRSAVTHNEYIADIDHATDALVHFFNETTFPYSFLGKSGLMVKSDAFHSSFFNFSSATLITPFSLFFGVFVLNESRQPSSLF